MFGRFGWAEILVIVVLVLILFGHNKIPGMMKNLADGINVFKKELKNTKAKKTDAGKKFDAPAEKPAAKSARRPADKKTSVKKQVVKSAAKKAKK